MHIHMNLFTKTNRKANEIYNSNANNIYIYMHTLVLVKRTEFQIFFNYRKY